MKFTFPPVFSQFYVWLTVRHVSDSFILSSFLSPQTKIDILILLFFWRLSGDQRTSDSSKCLHSPETDFQPFFFQKGKKENNMKM